MKSNDDFLAALPDQSHHERAIALLWYYRETQQFDERTPAELACDVRDAGFSKPHVTRLTEKLRRSKFVIRGSRKATFQINVRHVEDLSKRFRQYLDTPQTTVQQEYIPSSWVSGTRPYLEKLVYQINVAHEYRLFDCCAVMCRRLMETLIIDVYVNSKRHHEIQSNGNFVELGKLINHIVADASVVLGRNTRTTMADIKLLGDTAAHDRIYITEASDVDDVRTRYRKVIKELLDAVGINGE